MFPAAATAAKEAARVQRELDKQTHAREVATQQAADRRRAARQADAAAKFVANTRLSMVGHCWCVGSGVPGCM